MKKKHKIEQLKQLNSYFLFYIKFPQQYIIISINTENNKIPTVNAKPQ